MATVKEGAGPGQYNADRAISATKQRSRAAIINKSSDRRVFEAKAEEQTAGPGHYERTDGFGRNVKGMGFGKPRQEKVVIDNRDYGYDAKKEFIQTRNKSPSVIISKSKRIETFADKAQMETAGPGQYNTYKQFGKDARTISMSRTARDMKIEDSAGPGQYDYEKSMKVTREKSYSAIINRGAARAEITMKEQTEAGPGQYDDGVRFNSGSKSFRIGEKRAEIVKESMGPGAYEPERAEKITKTKVSNVTMGNSPSRATIVRKSIDIGPGQYNEQKMFGSETKTFKIGEKRASKIQESMGPGAYDADRADSITRTKI